jgi:hypothetical protein
MIKVITLPYNLDCPLKLQNLQELVIGEDICNNNKKTVSIRKTTKACFKVSQGNSILLFCG